mmetsp:Transcript_21032/g.58365  ORF Transcript_21032/g.58365 Transcript_21032/m.58365 type:complete len:240 (-) Transcript_21032:1278-1997(-)
MCEAEHSAVDLLECLAVVYRLPRSTSMLVLLTDIFGPDPKVPAALVRAACFAMEAVPGALRILAFWKAFSSGDRAAAVDALAVWRLEGGGLIRAATELGFLCTGAAADSCGAAAAGARPTLGSLLVPAGGGCAGEGARSSPCCAPPNSLANHCLKAAESSAEQDSSSFVVYSTSLLIICSSLKSSRYFALRSFNARRASYVSSSNTCPSTESPPPTASTFSFNASISLFVEFIRSAVSF